MKSAMKYLMVVFSILIITNTACADSQSEQLKQMVAQLQQSPSDNVLREKIIKLAKEIKPAPVVPEEARRAFVRGNTALSEAKGPDDYARAVQRYDEAIAIAPWWGEPYFNLAKALELRQEYGRAIQSLQLFIISGPVAESVRKAKDYSYALEDKQEKLTKEKYKQEVAARAEEAKYGWLIGKWKVHYRFVGGVVQWDTSALASRSGSQVKYTYASAKVGTAANGGPMTLLLESNTQAFLRSTLNESGDINWQFDFGSNPVNCPNQIGWQNINVVMSSDHRKLSITAPAMAVHTQPSCAQSGYYHEFTLTRE